jgi:hypothetical protein
MAKVFGWMLTGVLKSCSACAKVKATMKSVLKTTAEEHKATKPGEVLHLDTTGPYKRTRGKNRYLVCIKDAFTSLIWSEFGKEKIIFTDKINLILTNNKARGFPAKYFCDWIMWASGFGSNQCVQMIAEANRFAGIISDNDDSDDGDGNDSLGGDNAAAPAAGNQQQQEG